VYDPTFGARLESTVFYDMEAIGQLADDATVFLIYENDLAGRRRAVTALDITFARPVISRVIGRKLLGLGLGRRAAPRALLFSLSADFGGRRPLEKCRALGQDGLERVDILSHAITAADAGEFESGEGAAVGTEIPPGEEITSRGLVVDLGCGRQWQIELWRQMQVEIEVLLRRIGINICWVGEGRARRYHQQRQSLRACPVEELFLSIGDMVRSHSLDGVQ
jgi:hypothetical protein